MHTLTRLIIAAPLLVVNPALGQDLLGPIQDFVEGLTEQPVQRPTTPRPAPPVVQAVTPPPVPRPRPPSLPDGAVVEAEAVEAEPADVTDEEEDPSSAPAGHPGSSPGQALLPQGEKGEADAPVSAAEEQGPERVYQAACPAVLRGLVEAEMVAPLSEGACGEQSPLLVTGVMSGGRMVPLSSPVTVNCQMASALPDWISVVDGYAEAMLGSPLARLETGTSYMCRNRNNASEGLTSEHGFANAVDVTGFSLADGRSIAVETNWLPAGAPEGRLLRLAHDAACAGFTTTLGPEANAEHHDHLHLDMGCHGASCSARLCE